jgi:hypothetical protein
VVRFFVPSLSHFYLFILFSMEDFFTPQPQINIPSENKDLINFEDTPTNEGNVVANINESTSTHNVQTNPVDPTQHEEVQHIKPDVVITTEVSESLQSDQKITTDVAMSEGEAELDLPNERHVTQPSPSTKQPSAAASGDAKRDCPNGSHCTYTTNIQHVEEFSHPCKYGLNCRHQDNPVHSKRFSHPTPKQVSRSNRGNPYPFLFVIG